VSKSRVAGGAGGFDEADIGIHQNTAQARPRRNTRQSDSLFFDGTRCVLRFSCSCPSLVRAVVSLAVIYAMLLALDNREMGVEHQSKRTCVICVTGRRPAHNLRPGMESSC